MSVNPHANLDAPSAWVARFAALIPPGPALDLACGAGRHSRLLAGLGHPVLAVDRDAGLLAQAAGPGIDTLQIDLETTPPDSRIDALLAAQRFAGVVVTNYLHRPLLARIVDSIAPGGVLIYETFASGNGRFGKPSNPDFLLLPGELLGLVGGRRDAGWRVLAYEDGYVAAPRPAMMQRICAVRAGATDAADGLSAEQLAL